MVLCRYIELEFNSNCKCISNVDVDCSGYNDVIDLGSRHRDYYVDIGIFSEVAVAPYWFSRHRRRQRRFKTRARDWTLRAQREVEGKKDQEQEGRARNLKECSCLMMFKKGL